jgi:hypothetical protein
LHFAIESVRLKEEAEAAIGRRSQMKPPPPHANERIKNVNEQTRIRQKTTKDTKRQQKDGDCAAHL